jgi:hypothetical protein
MPAADGIQTSDTSVPMSFLLFVFDTVAFIPPNIKIKSLELRPQPPEVW